MSKRRKPRDLPEDLRNWHAKLQAANGRRYAQRAVERECEGCVACCRVKSVDSIAKPGFSWCPLVEIGTGCSSYATRPSSCATYYCAWRMGFGPASARPDRNGNAVVIDLQYSEHLREQTGATPFSIGSFVGVVRADRPFRLEPVAETVGDLALLGVRWYGCVGPETPAGEAFAMIRSPRDFARMLRHFALTGEAPWNLAGPRFGQPPEHEVGP